MGNQMSCGTVSKSLVHALHVGWMCRAEEDSENKVIQKNLVFGLAFLCSTKTT